MDKMQGVFAPEAVAQAVAEIPQKYMTPEEVETWYSEKEAAKVQESEQKKLQENITNQITEMSTKWSGEDGKPKYVDEEVIQWQRDNNKLYLMPEEAFTLMKRDDIINWETKQVLAR
jgi:hypothetical protein